MTGVRAQARQVVLVQVRLEPESAREIGERLERRPLLPGDARHAQQRGGVAQQGVRIEVHGARG